MAASSAAVLVGTTLLIFGWIGARAGSSRDAQELVQARDTQSSGSLGLSLFASGLGAWILFAPPEVGALVGVLGVFGYALGATSPVLFFTLVGPRLRRIQPHGSTISGFVKHRLGTTFSTYVVVISILYMVIFLTAELTALGAVVGLASGLDGGPVIIAVALVTASYTAFGGLRASLATDAWQGWAILGLLALAAPALIQVLPEGRPADPAQTWGLNKLGIEVAITLVLAVAAANLFHQGYWQRVWAAKDAGELRRAGWKGAAAVFPVILTVGGLGMLAARTGLDIGDPAVPFFALVTAGAEWLVPVTLVLALALVASSVDTLQNALVSLVADAKSDIPSSVLRTLTIALMIPAVLVALEGLSVLRLFLIADLLCAATAIPLLTTLSKRPNQRAALVGALAGLVGAAIVPVMTGGSVSDATFPGGAPTLMPFLGAVLFSGVAVLALPRSGNEDQR